MLHTSRGRLLVVVLYLATAAVATAQQRPSAPFSPPAPQPFVWWKSETFKRELMLTAEQTARIDKLWESTRLELRQEYTELSRLEEKFSHLLQKDADEATLARQIDRVETARANANKTRSLMLVQMRMVLTPDQRVRLDAIHARWLHSQKPPHLAAPPPPAQEPQRKPEE